MQVKKQQLKPEIEQHWFQIGKGELQGCILSPAYLTFLLEKAEEPETKLPTSSGSSKKQQSSRETSIFALLTMPKPWTVWITINCGKF